MKRIILDGKKIHDMDSFYDEVEKKFTKNLTWKIGHNLDAFNDLLKGGFGVHEYGEPIYIVWKDYDISKEKLGAVKILTILEIIIIHSQSGYECKLEIDYKE